MNRKQLSRLIIKHIQWYDKQAVHYNVGRLNLTWIKYAAKVPLDEWNGIKNASDSVPVSEYNRLLGNLKHIEQAVLYKQYHTDNISFVQAKQNTKRILQRVYQRQQDRRIITDIKKQKRNQRFNIFLDGSYAFPVSEDVLAKYHLRKGMRIPRALQRTISKDDNFSKIYNTAVRYLARQLRSKQEVLLKLQHSYPKARPGLIEHAIKKLETLHLIDDRHYASAYVRTASSVNRRGPYRITPYLNRKGISATLSKWALEKYYSVPQQIKVAAGLARDKYRMSGNKPFRRRIIKTKQHLANRGFSFNVIDTAINKCGFHPNTDRHRELLKEYAERAERKYGRRYQGYKKKIKIEQYLLRRGFSFDDINTVAD